MLRGGLALSLASKAAISFAMRNGCSASGLGEAAFASALGAGLAPSAANAGRASRQARRKAAGVRMGRGIRGGEGEGKSEIIKMRGVRPVPFTLPPDFRVS